MNLNCKKAIKTIIKANKVINPANPFYNKKVYDAVYDSIHYDSNTSKWVWTHQTRLNGSISNGNVIIVVLESPHVDEFNSKGNGTYPLINDSSFRSHFIQGLCNSKNLPNLNKQNTYYIYLMNAIQYQCSLGLPTGYFRDFVFLYFWERLKKDFSTRILTMAKQNTIFAVINLCTKGNHKHTTQLITRSGQISMYKSCCKSFFKNLGISNYQNLTNYSLQSIVDLEIMNIIKNNKIFHTIGTHPSSWIQKSTIL